MSRETKHRPLFNLVKLEGLGNGDSSAIQHFNRAFLDVTIAQDLPNWSLCWTLKILKRLQNMHIK